MNQMHIQAKTETITLTSIPGKSRPVSPHHAYARSIRLLWNVARRRRIERIASYAARSLLRPLQTAMWTAHLEQRFSVEYLKQHHRFYLKPHRPYLNRRYTFAQRAAVILTHYAQLDALLAPVPRQQILDGAAVSLARFHGKGERAYTVTLCRTDRFYREGELILALNDEGDATRVYMLVFSVNVVAGQRRIEIGCLQGHDDPDNKARIKLATKECYGSRPKNLVMDFLYALAHAWGITQIVAVTNKSRVFRSRAVFADYDSFWSELNGVSGHDGFVALPAMLPHQNPNDAPSHKRAEYRRRAELRTTLEHQIQARAAALFP